MKCDSFMTTLVRKASGDSRPTALGQAYRNPRNGEMIRVVEVRGACIIYNRAVSSEDGGSATIITGLAGFLQEFPLDKFEILGVMGDNEWLCQACPGAGLARSAVSHPAVTEIKFVIDPEAVPSPALRPEIEGLKRRFRVLQAA